MGPLGPDRIWFRQKILTNDLLLDGHVLDATLVQLLNGGMQVITPGQQKGLKVVGNH